MVDLQPGHRARLPVWTSERRIGNATSVDAAKEGELVSLLL
jgi:hypothetical protein